jgi:hypothetical protein
VSPRRSRYFTTTFAVAKSMLPPEDAPVLPWLPEDGPPVLDGELHAPTSAAIPTNEIRRAIIPAPAPSHPSQWIEKPASFHAPPVQPWRLQPF